MAGTQSGDINVYVYEIKEQRYSQGEKMKAHVRLETKEKRMTNECEGSLLVDAVCPPCCCLS